MTSDLLADCVTDEISRYHSTSKTAQEACETIARALEVCNEGLDEAGVLSSCLQNTAAYFSDNLMNALEACFFGSCDQITGCVLRVLDDYDADDLYDFFMYSLGISTGNSGGGGSGGGSDKPLTKEETCEAAIGLFNDTVSEMCLGAYYNCCFCTCWRIQQWENYGEEYCSCGIIEGDDFGLSLSGGCTDENAYWSARVLQDTELLEVEADYFMQQVCD